MIKYRLLFSSTAAVIFAACAVQNRSLEKAINNLRYVENMPYFSTFSGDSIFWEVVKNKKIIPALIDEISDTTDTNARVPYFGGYYTVGDACFLALIEWIPDLRTVQFIESNEKELAEKGAGVYWQYMRESIDNRIIFEQKVRAWYLQNRRKLVWIQDTNLYPIEDREDSKLRKRPAGGFFVLKENLHLYKR